MGEGYLLTCISYPTSDCVIHTHKEGDLYWGLLQSEIGIDLECSSVIVMDHWNDGKGCHRPLFL
jgi:hypothetical protein